MSALVATALVSTAAPAQQAGSQANFELAVKVKKAAADLAYRRCLAGQETIHEVNLLGRISTAVQSMLKGLSFSDRQRVIRGAIDAPASVRLTADRDVRACLERQTPAIEQSLMAELRRDGSTGAGTGGYPGAIDVLFTYNRKESLDPRLYSDNLRINLSEAGRRPFSMNVASQSRPDGSPYFVYTYFPFPSRRVEGTISAKPVNSRLTGDQVPRARVCFERVPKPPPPPPKNDLFKCLEGGTCQPSGASRGWLQPCAAGHPIAARAKGTQFASIVPLSGADVQAITAPVRRWVTPSIDTLAEREGEAVGWSYFKLRTSAFQDPGINAVEVGLAVNGIPVDEDGLAPEERPEPNDSSAPFDLLFPLQTLGLEGRRGGCDTVSVALTPLFADGRRGAPRVFDLSYAALRDQPPREEQSGGATLTWSATVVRPAREWRHWAFIKSYPFQYPDPISQQAAVRSAEADKEWLDGASLTYQGAQVRGVIRPPLSIKQDRASYGLAVGLLQSNGQVRFTFSEQDARTIGQWMVAQRQSGPRAQQVIDAKPYLYQAPSGGITPAGICNSA
jgi:hypothetical protein